MDGEQPTE